MINELMRKPIIFLTAFLLLAFSINAFSQDDKKEFMVFLESNPGKEDLRSEEVKKLQKGHLDNIDRLYEEGKLIAAGPFKDKGGLFIVLANDKNEVIEIIESDPAIKEKRFRVEILPLNRFSGGVCKYNRPVNLKRYSFVRLTKTNKIDKEKELSFDSHADYYSKIGKVDSLLFASYFYENDGGVLIFDIKLEQEIQQIMQTDPFVRAGIFKYEIRTLMIAEGTFCRKDY